MDMLMLVIRNWKMAFLLMYYILIICVYIHMVFIISKWNHSKTLFQLQLFQLKSFIPFLLLIIIQFQYLGL